MLKMDVVVEYGRIWVEASTVMPTGSVRVRGEITPDDAAELADKLAETLSRFRTVVVDDFNDEDLGAGTRLDGIASAWIHAVSTLSPREREVSAWIVSGAPPDVIASQLRISTHTARNHTKSILRKLGVDKVTKAVFGLRAGGIRPAVEIVPGSTGTISRGRPSVG